MAQQLIIDSSQAIGSSVNNSMFTVQLNPSMTIKRAKLLFASIPSSETNTQSYWLISIHELGIHCRGGNGMATGCTFCVPVSATNGFRSLHSEQSDYISIVNTGAENQLSQLTVHIKHVNGELAEDAGAVLMILEVL
jgi:hypothetical protein